MEERLIFAVSAHPELYDVTCPFYSIRTKKERAWMSISQNVGMPMERCKSKWKNLRDTYTRERKKVSRCGAAARTAKRWKYLGILSFLDPFIVPRDASGSTEQEVEEDWASKSRESDEEGETAGPSQTEDGIFSEDGDEGPAASTPVTPATPAPLTPPAPGSPAFGPSSAPAAAATHALVARPVLGRKIAKKRVREDEDSRNREIQDLLLETLRALQDQSACSPAPTPPRSEDQLFLDSIAPSLERLDPQVKARVKFEIHKIIYEASTVVRNLEPAE
ncbi:transcription factor Adf-1-like isoform X2 [Salarias fasciatus]|uniref:transcription factor Adf-1-like isoform X2 n=1 Tax=Salarias fasciatus TaxID=181472 RepID=UPI001177086D|nr:transcription factor Adf-1-like isoform X2 [Salarias fasciatus]